MLLSDDTRLAVAAVGSVINVCGYIPYIVDIFRGKTKPHAFSWCIWGILSAIGFAGQIADQGGVGSCILGVSAAACLLIFALSLFKGEQNITRSDWWCFLLALAAIPLWIITATPIWSMILITVIDAVGFIPTIRKSFFDPFAETISTWIVSSLKFILAIVALEHISIVTALYPAALILMNGTFVIMLCIRRKTISASTKAL